MSDIKDFKMPTLGNDIGSIGSAASSLINVGIALSSKDKVAPNPFSTYATDTLNTINETKALAAKQRDLQLAQVEGDKTTQEAKNRTMSRDVGSYRALNLATYLGGMQEKRKVEENYLSNLEGLNMKKANVELNRDRVIMGSQDAYNERVQQEKDAYRTSLSAAFSGLGTTAENIGRNVNTTASTEMAMKIAGNAGKYGNYTDFLKYLVDPSSSNK